MTAEMRYADNVPPVYGGSRFYRGTAAPPPESTHVREAEAPVSTPALGIPVEYTVRPSEESETPPPQEIPPAEEPSKPCDAAPVHAGGLPAFLTGDAEEILLIVLILLLGGEAERAADVIVILLLLLTVR